MANEWRTVKLGELCSKIGSGATPRGGSKVYLEHGPFALVRSQNVRNDSFTRDGLAYINAEQADGLANVELQPKDVLLNITGDSVARCCLVDEGILPGRVNQHVAIIRPRPEELDPVFLRYFLVSPEMQEKMLSWAGAGGTRSALTKGMIEAFELPCPPITEQRAIAHVLGTLDDKIACNRRLNRTLEDIVRALFKSWFIDFDPVIDNALAAGNPIPDELADRAALRQQAAEEHAMPLPDDLRALFPAEFTHTDTMGWIPKGWEVAPLSTLARLNPHAWTARNAPKHVRYIDLANTKNGSINEVVEYSFDAAPSRARRILYPGDTVFGTVRPGNRSFAYIHEEGLTGSTGFAVLHPLREAYQEFIYLATTRDEIVDLFAHLADGAAYPAVRAEVVIEQVHAMPPTQIVEAFHDSVAAEIVSIGQRSAQNQKLSALRDTLLPKLLSGEVHLEGRDG